MKTKLILAIITFFFCQFSFSQNQLKSIQLKGIGAKNSSTIVPLGTIVELSFDDLQANQQEYWYLIEHMTYDWKPSGIATNEYITGFNNYQITNYENAFNTLQDYTHYSVQIPNENTTITKTGNYKITVLDAENNPVFSRRLTLYKNNTVVAVSVARSKNTQLNNQQQTVQFTVNYNTNQIRNPSQQIKTVVLQNNNWNTAIKNIQPQYFRNNQLVYKYIDETNFWSGNEYLNFDTKQIRNTSTQIAKVEKRDIYYSYLYPQDRRDNKTYTYSPDINGQFLIRTLDGNNSSTEADYTKVFFNLTSEKLKNKKVYVYGAFNNFKLTNENLMTYNLSTNTYQTTLLLKQGFYNYTFATSSDNNLVNLHELNGSFSETENEYTVLIYYRAFGEYYDQVIGVGTGFTNKQQ
ncbi:MAG: DUF5103 domain-containing protein [Flavobacteriaceae bacterium]|nr:DUF5103 domain-containing protein [Flavobacteriaceae bacterium]